MAHYIGIIHKEAESEYGISFPDFPGCVTAGENLEELATMAKEALSLHMQGMLEDGETLPAPMSLEQAQAHEFAQGAFSFYLAEAQPPSKPVRVNVMLDSGVLNEIKKLGRKRSDFLNQAAREKLGMPHPN